MTLSRSNLLLLACVFSAFYSFEAPYARAVQVWESTFDSTADGVVDIADNENPKIMIGGVSGGRLQITTEDVASPSFTPDKAGRPLGVTLGGNDSMSGQYKFNWSQLNQQVPFAYELVGFLGLTGPQTRQVLGTIMRHWVVSGTSDHYVALDIGAGSVGFSANFGYLAGNSTYIGTNPTADDFELQVEYDGTTHALSVSLLDDAGSLLTTNSADLDTLFTTQSALEISSFALTHLGWEDYSGNLNGFTTTWQVDSLAYFDEAQVPEPFAPNADYNDDGETDAADYVAWRKNFGATGAPGTLIGDGTSNDLLGVPDGDVDLFDYDFWKSKFGTPVSGGSASFASGVPEPTSAFLVIVAAAGLMVSARRNRAFSE